METLKVMYNSMSGILSSKFHANNYHKHKSKNVGASKSNNKI